MSTDQHSLSIGELAQRTGASVRSIRHYEQNGLLAAARNTGGHRRFGPDAVETVGRIRLLLSGGLPLSIVAKIMPCFAAEGVALDPCVQDYLREHLDVVEERIHTLDEQRDGIERLQALVAV